MVVRRCCRLFRFVFEENEKTSKRSRRSRRRKKVTVYLSSYARVYIVHTLYPLHIVKVMYTYTLRSATERLCSTHIHFIRRRRLFCSSFRMCFVFGCVSSCVYECAWVYSGPPSMCVCASVTWHCLCACDCVLEGTLGCTLCVKHNIIISRHSQSV